MRDTDWTKILGWPGYAVYQHEIDEKAKTLRLWVRRKRGNRRLICSGCGRRIKAPDCAIVYDKFHIMQHANKAVDEVRRAEFFRKGGRMRSVVKGKRWLLLTRWVNLAAGGRQQLNLLFSLNRRVMKAYLLKESLERLWTYTYEGAALRYLKSWTLQLRWQRLPAFDKLAHMLIDHLDGILSYCHVKVRFGVVEAINGNIKTLLRRGRGYKNLRYLLLKAQRMAATKTEFIAVQKAA